MKRISSCLAFLCFAMGISYGQRRDVVFEWAVAASGVSFHSDIVYTKGNGQDQKLDVIVIDPPSQARPTLLYIHGGGWVNGKKGSTTLAPLPYLARGMNTVNVDYRLAEESVAPAAVEDCRCALRWIFRHAKDYGFDTNKIVVAGESAGGHLALTTAMLQASDGFDTGCPAQEGDVPLKAAAVVSYSGPADVADLLEGPHQQWFAQSWLGSNPNRIDLARHLSPVNYVRPGLPPIILAHGDTDPYVDYGQIARFHQLLDKAGAPNVLITLPGPIHGWAVEKELKVEEQVFEALEKYGILSRESH
jgi:acetyl esterase/lipase